MYKFDTKVQHLKYKVLRSVAKHCWEGSLNEALLDIPREIIPGKTPTMRCCIYKERAILAERVKLALGAVSYTHLIDCSRKRRRPSDIR